MAKQRLSKLISEWPLFKQFKSGDWEARGDITWSERTKTLQPRNAGAEVARSVCPYCAVGCGQLVFHKDNQIVSIEGDPESPISRGRLCPKGANSQELVQSKSRFYKVKYRAPFAKEWSEIPLEQAMDMIADRVWETRKRTYDRENGNNTTAICHLGGATLDNEENYLLKKLYCAIGMVAVSNQARI